VNPSTDVSWNKLSQANVHRKRRSKRAIRREEEKKIEEEDQYICQFKLLCLVLQNKSK